MTAIPKRYTPDQAAPLIGKSVSWLKEKAAKREIPSHKIGRDRFFTEDDVAEIIENGAVPAASPAPRTSGARKRKPGTVTRLQSRPVDRPSRDAA